MSIRSAAPRVWDAALDFCTSYSPGGFEQDLDRIRNLPPPGKFSDREFYREYCWVVLHAGVSTVAARAIQHRVWPILDQPLRRIVNNMDRVRQQVYGVYRHQRKVEAMVEMAGVLHRKPGIGPRLEQMGVESALDHMQTLDGIGKVTKYHLARNIGFDVVKPDRHLSRLADVMGTTPTELCQAVRKATGERVGAIDFALYQWCAWAGFDHVADHVKAIC